MYPLQVRNGYTIKPVFNGYVWDKEEVAFYDRCHLNRGSIQTKLSMIGQEKYYLLIQVTA